MAVVDPTLEFEKELFSAGVSVVIGIDEVGRGALAGPVVVGVCAITSTVEGFPDGLRDSKMLSEKRRSLVYPEVCGWGITATGSASPQEIDEFGISHCLGLAAKRALAAVFHAGADVAAATIILDGSHDWLTPVLATPVPVRLRVKADQDCASVAGASVVAKVERDTLMVALASDFPAYGWESNKGYGAAVHMSAIAEQGITIHHRASWVTP